ncbi:MAG: GTPase HflX [Oscillospiraceae bacterium]|nr:GTPase HflX [Oscillospiraceae bacterium]
MTIKENTIEPARVILVCVDTGAFDAERSVRELEELARTAGAEVLGQVIQKRPSYDSATCIGEGKLEELAQTVKDWEIGLVVFDSELSPNQTRNIERILDVRVIDRTTLILDIFAQRALSKEGKLQVELAQQRYRLPHLAGKGIEMSRLGGGTAGGGLSGIGARGPGETKLETDKRHIRRRIESLEAELKELERRRGLMRERRKKDNVLTAALVGYTNVGKSTLLNALTDAGVLVENKLFATLDTTSRALNLPDGRTVLLIDTVGLIRRLPHELVQAFKSTLEEAASADIIISLIDLSAEDGFEQSEVTDKLLVELGCGNIPKINVLNKCDKVDNAEELYCDDKTAVISAKHKKGFDELLDCIARNLPETAKRGKFLIPYDKTGVINTIRIDGKVFSEEFTPNGTLIDALVDCKIFHLVEEMLCN